MAEIHIHGPVKGPEGYSLLARDVIAEFQKRGHDVSLDEFVGWGKHEVILSEASHRSLGQALARNRELANRAPIGANLNITLPIQAKRYESSFNAVYTMFETDRICSEWCEALSRFDRVVVPTVFNAESFALSDPTLVRSRLSIAGIGYDPLRYNSEVPPLALTADDAELLRFKARVIAICEPVPRKNFFGLLELYLRAAASSDPADSCLILRVGSNSASISIRDLVSDFITKRVAAGAIPALDYNVFTYPVIVPETLHANFIAIGTHYLSASFGEGWDLTAMQAAACGLGVFVPAHSAYECWLNEEVAVLFPISAAVPAAQPGSTARFYHGSRWFALDLPSSSEVLAESFRSPEFFERTKALMSSYIKNFTWDRVIPEWERALCV